MGHCVLSFVSSNEILCGLVILVCSGNRSILDLGLFNPLCRQYGSLCWFFKLISGVGQDGGVSFVEHCVLSFVSSNEILCGLVILVCSGNRSILDLGLFNPLCRRYWISALVVQMDLRCGAEWRCVIRGALCPLVRLV